MIITLGYRCNITFLNEGLHLKKETSVFEWLESRNLQYITDIINTLTLNPLSNIIYGIYGTDKIYLLNSNFFTCHYNVEEFKIIFKRRYDRFINNINKEENIYFVRLNPLGENTSKNEIELFIESIKRINPNIKFNFLLIDTVNNDCDFNYITIDVDNVIFHHKYFYVNDFKDINDVFMHGCVTIYEKYKKILEDIGYNVNDISDATFSDRSQF